MKIDKGKQTRQLPQRGALNDLAKSDRTIVDYSKATPISPSEPKPNVIENLRRAPRG